MKGLVFFLLLIHMCFSLLSVQEIQKRLEDAYSKENAHVEDQRLNFVNTVLPILEKSIIEGKIAVYFRPNDSAGYECNGRYEDIRPKTFCDWWNQYFNTTTTCTFAPEVQSCPLAISFAKK